MPRRVTLFALWVVFAVASVSVGFGAASLVSDPFTDVGTSTGVTDVADGDDGAVTEPGSTSSPTSSPSSSSTKHQTNSPTQSPTTSRGTHTPGSTKTSTPLGAVHRGIGTKGGYVSATCRGDLVSVGAAPAVWWQVDSITRGQVRSARVRLEPSEDANGERVEVTATCSHGIPLLTSDYHSADGGDDGGGGGGDDSGGGSGGSDDSSGSGDG